MKSAARPPRYRSTVLKVVLGLFIVLLGLGVATRADVSPTPTPLPTIGITPDFISKLLAEARAHNPSIAAASSRADAANSAVEGVRTWEDPLFMVGLSVPTARGFKSSEEGDIIYGVQQKLPLYDRPKLTRAVAEAGALKEKLTVSYETEKLRRELTLALIDLALNDSQIDLAQEDLGWINVTSSAVDQQYRVGKRSQVDGLKIQIEKAKLVDHLKTLRAEREHQQVQVNRLLNRELHAAWPLVELPDLYLPLGDGDALVEAAVQAEPSLQIKRQATLEAEAIARFTRQTRKPEFGIGVQGRSYSGDAGFREGMLTFNFTLPRLNDRRYESDFQRDRSKVLASENDTADFVLTIREEVYHLIVEVDAARRRALLYRDELIPLTQQTLVSANSAWAQSLGVFQDVLDVRRMLVDQRLTVAESLAEQARQLAELSFITGHVDLTAFIQASIMPSVSMATPGDTQ